MYVIVVTLKLFLLLGMQQIVGTVILLVDIRIELLLKTTAPPSNVQRVRVVGVLHTRLQLL